MNTLLAILFLCTPVDGDGDRYGFEITASMQGEVLEFQSEQIGRVQCLPDPAIPCVNSDRSLEIRFTEKLLHGQAPAAVFFIRRAAQYTETHFYSCAPESVFQLD
ncbi:MAG: hypothetical protein A2428_10685 [Bdellovibrionales bacterium RIFOXYC1_FULL_54_43]|nr:MAG: hypothetical protein A2428_10685 [Bdellovibrionales bacterium RIFOXYC1_FULL_54_43]OFZ85357.1 MAG: hypothetical protein A2603_05460 [Bdellovibrionales bacterium RIFOXYD1_FULL_55_31]